MTLLPRSLVGRLLAVAGLSTLTALLFAGFAIGQVLEHFVMEGLDQRLDAQVAVLARAVRPDGRIDAARAIDLPRFDTAGSGWVWRIALPDETVRRNDPGADGLPPIEAEPNPPPPDDRRGRAPHAGDRGGGDGLHYRWRTIATRAGPVTIVAGGPRAVALRPLRAAMMPLILSLALLGIALALATLVQVRIGLRPLRTVARSLADVRAGRRRHVSPDQPTELVPLVTELNALIDQNAAGLDHARRHVANLAHGVKTPLAALGVTLAESGRDPDGVLRAMVERIDAQVRHHLGRARASAPGAAMRVRTAVAPAVADLVAVMRQVHADAGRDVASTIAADVDVAVDSHDLSEMIGNLVDNGWRHARGRIAIRAERDGAMVRIAIEDDGPGLDDGAAAEAMVPGRRLDERGDGHGFGLPIARELAELNGGALTLDLSPVLGGLRAVLTLPAPVGE